MSQELIDRIRKRKDNPISSDWREIQGEQKALRWVLRIFKEQEKSLKRRVLTEKVKKKRVKKKKQPRRREPEPDYPILNRPIVQPLFRSGFFGLGWGHEIM